MKLLLLVTLFACTYSVMGDGLIPKIELPTALTNLIPSAFLKPLDLLNGQLDKLNGFLDLDKWKDVLSTSGDAGKQVFNTLMNVVTLFKNGDYTNPFSIADIANDGYKAIGKVQEAIQKVNDIPMYIPFLNYLNTTLENMRGNLKTIRCIRPANCVDLSGVFGGWFGRRR